MSQVPVHEYTGCIVEASYQGVGVALNDTKPNVLHKRHPVYIGSLSRLYILHNRRFYNIGRVGSYLSKIPTNQLLCAGCIMKNGKNKSVLVSNADSNESPFTTDLCSISFRCLGRLFTDSPNDEQIMKASNRPTLVLLTYTDDEYIAFTKEEQKSYSSNNIKLIPPQPGFTALANGWHRSGSALLMDTKTKKHYLLGFDDGQYFGVILAGKPKTINQAYVDLTPTEARRKIGVMRQGEWFFVPTPTSKVPEPDFTKTQIRSCVLPMDHQDSNEHSVEAHEVRVGTNGRLFVRDFSVSHQEHPQIVSQKYTQWYSIVKNTAIKSVSQVGVD